jgi:hypothetical protein
LKFDIVAEDARGRDVLIVDVSAMKLSEELARQTLDYMRGAELPVRFGMVADPDKIRIADYEKDGADSVVCTLDTSEMLRHYAPDLGTRRVFHHYLATLVDAWLRDHVYHWKTLTPPGAGPLASIGLLPCLEDGDTRREVVLGADPVS